jgi:hypothetical protein
MAELLPWLAIAGAGALHGLSPANGWLLAAACGVHARDEAEARRALRPIAFGQLASMLVLACAFSIGVSVDRALIREIAVALLAAASLWLWLRRTGLTRRVGAPIRDTGIALWSFVAASAQGAGLMLIPALVPLCAGAPLAHGFAVPRSLAIALASVALHTGAMLFTTGLAASSACRAIAVTRR